MNDHSKNNIQNSSSINTKKVEKQVLSISLGNKIFLSLKSGIFAFSIVLILLSITKLLALSVGSSDNFVLNLNDIIYSFWAFLVISFIEIAGYLKAK